MRTTARIAVGGVVAALVLPSAASAQPQTWLPWEAGERHQTLAGNDERSNVGDLAHAFDFQMASGTPILASAPGQVESVVANCTAGQPRCGQSYGNNVLVCYPDGTCSRYAHLSTVSVSPGDDVAQAQLIGSSGQTGAAGGIPRVQYQAEDKSAPNQTIPTSFEDGGTPRGGDFVTSQNTSMVGAGAGDPASPDNRRVELLEEQVDRLEQWLEIVILPMTFLVGILALGGAIGVVFSIRDQRRVSQLHELAVGSEMAAQRRTEQSFTAFLDGSQKTLTLVNDTLALAKQATESERHALKRKTSAGLKEVEEKAEDLVLRVAKKEDFDLLLDVRENRAELERIASELRRLETYRQLQEDIELPPYCQFVLGIQEFLDDAARTALRTLRPATEAPKPQLQRMALYWSAKLNMALGEYDDARWLLTRAVRESKDTTRIACLEYERLLREVEFYEFAESHPNATPRERYEGLRTIIKDLAKIAPVLEERTKNDDDQHPNHEMRATRANVFMWIAYDPDNLAEPLADRLKERDVDIKEFQREDPPKDDGDAMRAWAVWQAEEYYPEAKELHDDQADVDFALRIGRIESDFAVGTAQHDAYPRLERHALDDQRREHREHRHTIELAQIAVICEARLLYFADAATTDPRQAERALHDAMGDLANAAVTAPDHNVTVFSHLQRRNLRMKELEDEAQQLETQTLAMWKRKVDEAKAKAEAEAKAKAEAEAKAGSEGTSESEGANGDPA